MSDIQATFVWVSDPGVCDSGSLGSSRSGVIGSLLCGGSGAVRVGSEGELVTYMQLSVRAVTLRLVG